MAAADPSPLDAASLFARARAALEEESPERSAAATLELIAEVVGAESGALFFDRDGELKDEHWHGPHPSETEERLRAAARVPGANGDAGVFPLAAHDRSFGAFCFANAANGAASAVAQAIADLFASRVSARRESEHAAA